MAQFGKLTFVLLTLQFFIQEEFPLTTLGMEVRFNSRTVSLGSIVVSKDLYSVVGKRLRPKTFTTFSPPMTRI